MIKAITRGLQGSEVFLLNLPDLSSSIPKLADAQEG